MDVINLGKTRHFLQAKAVDLSLFDRPHMVCDLLCLTPGQRQERRAQDNCDELYLVIEGHASLGVGSVLHELEALDALVVPPGVERWVANEDESPLTVLAVMAPNPKHVSIRPPQRLPQRRPALVQREYEEDEEEGEGLSRLPAPSPLSQGGAGTARREADEGRGPRALPERGPRRAEGPVRGSRERPHFEDNERDERNSIPEEGAPRRERPPASQRAHGAAGRFANTRAPRFGGGRGGDGRPAAGPPRRSGPARAGGRPFAGPRSEAEGPTGGAGRPAFRPARPASGARGRPERPGGTRSFGGGRGRPSPEGEGAGSRPFGPPRGRTGPGGPRGTAPRGRDEGPADAGARRFGPPRGASGDSYAPPRGRGASSRPPASGAGRPRGGGGGAKPGQRGRPGPGRSGPRP